ncbi:MAG: GNAT family N-acetyltransferase [Sulfobacillus thermotolerans]|uniref:N-acetyltransferase domain-containing protein n=1 Tax=Sulfobacillus thermotolerans TaxID=338644 RepID=A0ABM6RSG0_9FIRM|nr:hypothetical protein BXT84_11050 [Sulfobacillus thermotolerans]MCY0907563.1 GNAT family N-acetyltransferase [Sulfobacillus thermotolerans]
MAEKHILTDGIVQLRPFCEADMRLPQVLNWYKDREVLDGVEGPLAQPYDQARLERMYRYLNDHAELYMIEVRGVRGWETIGDVALAPDMLPIVIGEAEWRSRGIGSRVLALLIDRARELGYSSLWAKTIWTDNINSQRLFERMGGAPIFMMRCQRTGVNKACQRLWCDSYRWPPSSPTSRRVLAVGGIFRRANGNSSGKSTTRSARSCTIKRMPRIFGKRVRSDPTGGQEQNRSEL